MDAASLNADASVGRLNSQALTKLLQEQGDLVYDRIARLCPHLFAHVIVFINYAQLKQMTEVIESVERVLTQNEGTASVYGPGVFYGYDFHLNAEGVHLIEINTNAGGAFLNALLLDSQRDEEFPGEAVAQADLESVFVAMFINEWQLQRGKVKLVRIAILDEAPEEQYLYPEFLLAKNMFMRAGIQVCIIDPSELKLHDDGLYVENQKIDLIYNRLTDFMLLKHPDLLNAYLEDRVVLTPSPAHYSRYADKRNLAKLTDMEQLRQLGACEHDMKILQGGIPATLIVRSEDEEKLWDQRKRLFFKPYSGYASRGAYRGEKLTRRVFAEILQSDYVAQQLAAPGERCVLAGESLKYDVRCYVYEGKVQMMAARLYQGQTTNFRTPGGGFAPVRVVG